MAFHYPFSVPVNETVVTASHAIFVEKGGYKAPAAVVGLQYKYSAFRETFFNITSGVSYRVPLRGTLVTGKTFEFPFEQCTGGVSCRRTCSSGDLACYVIDNHGYVVISKDERETGKFFGEIDWLVMDSLIHYGVFRRCVTRSTLGFA